MYWKALSISPPLQPLFVVLQSTSCCSDKDTKLPDFLACWPSNEPVVEKAQQEPHCPWFFTAVTQPLVRQSTVSGTSSTVVSSFTKVPEASTLSDDLNPFIVDDISLESISVNLLIPILNDSSPAANRALCFSISATLSKKTVIRRASSISDE